MNGVMNLTGLLRKGILSLGQRCPKTQSSLIRCLTTTRVSHGAATKTEEDFFEKNERLKRPMSPFLSIYKFQITSVLSISHRGTGLAVSGLVSLFAAGTLLSPSSFPALLASIEAAQFGSATIFAAKYILAFPVVFHTLNGIRHLVWDMGKGFELKQVYASGYTVLALSVLFATLLAAM